MENLENLTFQKAAMQLYLLSNKKAARKEWNGVMYVKISPEKENTYFGLDLIKTEDETKLPWFTGEEDIKQEDWYIFE
jgi:hypothetical protein